MENTDEDWEENHSPPCPPGSSCIECEAYWDLMRSDGLWTDGKGWTAKGMRALTKL